MSKTQRTLSLKVQSRALGDSLFAPEQNLLRIAQPIPGRSGFVVAQQSLEYAIALIETSSGSNDTARANAIINRVLEFQLRDPCHHRFGNFMWMSHWDEPRDPNAVAFLTPNLVYLHQHHGSSLSSETHAGLEAAFPLCAHALLQRDVPYEYTNIKVLTTLAQFLLAPLVPESSLESTARFHWQHWLAFTAQYGIPEYNSPTYHPVVLHALEELWQYGPQDMRTAFERMLEYFYFEFAARYHAQSGYLAGAMSRAYPHDLKTGQGLSALVAHLQWGTGYQLARMNDVRWLRSSYQVPDEVRQIAFDKPLPLEIKAETFQARPVTRTDYFAADYSLGSQNGYSGNQEVPLFITACGKGHQRSSHIEASAPEHCRMASEQKTNCVGGYYYYDPQQVRDNSVLRAAQPEQELTLRWLLGHRLMVKSLLLNGTVWKGEHATLPLEGTIAMEFGEAVLGIRFEVDQEVAAFAHPTPLQLLWEVDTLVLSVCVCPTVAQFVEHGSPLGLNFYLQIESANSTSLEETQQALYSTSLEYPQNLSEPTAKNLQVRNGSTSLSAKVPLPQYLHHSTLAHIKPNDLLPWFEGQEEAGRRRLFGTVLDRIQC